MDEYRDYSLDRLVELADEDDAAANRELAARYRDGIGVPTDEELAEEYEKHARELDGDETDDFSDWSGDAGDDAEEDDVSEEPEAGAEAAEPVSELSEHASDPDYSDAGQVPEDENLKEKDTFKLWESEREGIGSATVLRLGQESDQGNPFAMKALAQRYMRSADRGGPERGFRLLEKAKDALQERLRTQDAEDMIVKTEQAEVLSLLGTCWENGYGTAADAEKAFQCYGNAFDLNHSFSDNYIRCLLHGIGCKADADRAESVKETQAREGGIVPKVELGIQYLNNGESIKAAGWLQRALTAEDAEEHRIMQTAARYLLSINNETDQNGKSIDQNHESDLLEQAAYQGDPDAAYILAVEDFYLGRQERETFLETAQDSALSGAKDYCRTELAKIEEKKTAEKKKREEDQRQQAAADEKRREIEEQNRRWQEQKRREEEEAAERRRIAEQNRLAYEARLAEMKAKAEAEKAQLERERVRQAEEEERERARLAEEEEREQARRAEEEAKEKARQEQLRQMREQAERMERARIAAFRAQRKQVLRPVFSRWRWSGILLAVLVSIFTLLTTITGFSTVLCVVCLAMAVYFTALLEKERTQNRIFKGTPEVFAIYTVEFLILSVCIAAAAIVVNLLA